MPFSPLPGAKGGVRNANHHGTFRVNASRGAQQAAGPADEAALQAWWPEDELEVHAAGADVQKMCGEWILGAQQQWYASRAAMHACAECCC